ncbi:MAG: HAE1 family hydrophobic/amphiphilic exporter-1 [Gammaproteobacteria bacterium]|jgi:HAE1 family hydrophobic/amphiphilic exporter-1
MAVIPKSLTGVIFGHMALGYDLTLPSMAGMASLVGVLGQRDAQLVV